MTLLAILIGLASFFNFTWYQSTSNVFQLIIQVVLAISALAVFIAYKGPKFQKFLMWHWEQNTYWNLPRGIQFIALLGTISILVVMFLGLK